MRSYIGDVISKWNNVRERMNARLLLMQKKGLSLSVAVAFIEETKNNLK